MWGHQAEPVGATWVPVTASLPSAPLVKFGDLQGPCFAHLFRGAMVVSCTRTLMKRLMPSLSGPGAVPLITCCNCPPG